MMNERIQELALEADAYADAMDVGGKNYIGLRDNYFAELIVRECADVVQNAVDHREPASTYVDKIKQHFGVE